MKIAVTCEKEEIFQHFGHTPEFAIFEIADGAVVSEKRLSTGGSGHGALAALLALESVDVLICGGIGGGAVNALTNAGIQVVGGASGNVKEVAGAFAAGNLEVRADFHCNHHHDHGEGHSCGSHSSGHSCGGNCSH